MTPASPTGGFLTVLKKRNFLYLWLAQLISMTVLQAANYALLILIENTTRSTTLIGLAIIAFSLPAILFGAPAGVLVDHMHKRRVMWISNCLRALATFLFVVVLLTNRRGGLIPIYLLTFLISAIGQFFAPAEGSTIPMLVAENEMMPALSLFNITFMLSQALGYVILAPIGLTLLRTVTFQGITLDAIAQLYIIGGLLYLVCALLILAIPRSAFRASSMHGVNLAKAQAETLGIMSQVWQEMRQGWRFVRQDRLLFLGVVQLSFAGVLILVIGQLAMPIVTQLLLLSPDAMAFVFAPAGIGLVAGSVAIPRISRRLGHTRTVFVGLLVLTGATLLLPLLTALARWLQPHAWNTNPLLLVGIALCMLMAGFALNFVNIPAQTVMQERTPDWIKGRVLALQLVLYNACSIPVILFIGGLSDLKQFGISHVLYLLAACELIFGCWGVYYMRKHTDAPPPLASNKSDDTNWQPVRTLVDEASVSESRKIGL